MIASLLMAGLSGCGLIREKRYQCIDDGFSISFPRDWRVTENAKGTRILADIPDAEGSSVIRQNVSVVVEEAHLPVDLKQYMDLQIDGLRKLKGVKIYEQGNAVINGAAAQWFSYSFTINDFGYKALVYTLRKERKFYVITGISQCNNYGRHVSRFHETAKSFKFEERASGG